MPTTQDIKIELEKSGFFVSEKAINELVEEFGSKTDTIKHNILDTDFKVTGDKILPKDISKTKENQVDFTFLLLMLEIVCETACSSANRFNSKYFTARKQTVEFNPC